MSTGSVVGLHYLSRTPMRLSWSNGAISGLDVVKEAPSDVWLAPALVELQVNGYGGVDFWDGAATSDNLATAVKALNRDACGMTLLTLITNPWKELIERIRTFRAILERTPELRRHFVGWHIEGPFLSEVPGYKGAHDPANMCDATPEKIRELRSATGNDPFLLTVAPERNFGIEAVALATSLGITVSLGHTNASEAQLRAAVAAGARGFTHLGNGCPQQLDRHDNIVWRVLNTPGLTAGIIPDSTHVSPMAFRVMHRALDTNRIYYTTDAVMPAGMPPGRFRMGGTDYDVGEDQVVREPGKSNFAGSALRPVEGVFRAADMLGCAWQESWHRFSQQPADFMRLGRLLTVGSPANFCLIDKPSTASGTVTTYIAGEVKGNVPSRAKVASAQRS